MNKPHGHIRLIVISLLLLFGSINSSFSQTEIGGIINKYAHVVELGSNYVDVETAEQYQQFSVGDTVMLIQMKGAIVYTAEVGVAFGSPNSCVGDPGAHEFFIVKALNAVTNRILLSGDIKAIFDKSGLVQLVRIPSYHSAVVTSELTAAPWDSTTVTGGVLALFAGKKLVLDAAINVTGKGFKGGEQKQGEPFCSSLSFKYGYNVNFDSAGLKGEGLAINTYPLWRGRGPNFTGGGGGNGHFSGGGGGSNYGAGGSGGYEIPECDAYPGGNGGRSVLNVGGMHDFTGGLFLGGGGGASRYSTGEASDGGNGGGIVIIICDSLLVGDDNKIIADGAAPSKTASGLAGAGGGGGGGSIAIFTQGFSSDSIYLSAKGGNGGNHAREAGEGGGGGGGYVTVNDVALANVYMDTLGGEQGNVADYFVPQALEGSPGQTANNYEPFLNGFLFNIIWSEVNGSQVDSICSNIVPRKIVGTVPTGTQPFTYQWQRAADVSDKDTYTIIGGADAMNYESLTVEADTFWIRRIVLDSSTPAPISDTSKWVEMVVQPKILNNFIGQDTIICYGQTANTLVPTNNDPTGGNGIFSYRWIQSTDNNNFANVVGDNVTFSSFNPPTLYETTYYKRVVTSGRCENISDVVTITVLPAIDGNITTRSDSIICEGSLFEPVAVSSPTGGDGTYSYLWQESLDKVSWANAFGGNTTEGYIPDTSQFSTQEHIYYRRRVHSGADNVCVGYSSPIMMTRYHAIANNSILGDDVICAGSDPDALIGTIPSHGSGTYAYIWQDSTALVGWMPVGSGINFAPPAFTDSTWYRRIVNSSVCSDTSLLVTVYAHPTAYAGKDIAVCGPEVLMAAVPTYGVGNWTFPSSVLQGDASKYNTLIKIDSSFNTAGVTYSFIWEENNAQCTDRDTINVEFFNRITDVSAGNDTTISTFDQVIYLAASSLKPYETGSWSVDVGGGSFMEPASSTTEVRNVAFGSNSYKWTVVNGACVETAIINIDALNVVVPEGLSPNGDGINDLLIITGLELDSQLAELTIVNGVGKKIFTTSNADGAEWENWDGTNISGDSLPEGTYHYLLKVISQRTGVTVMMNGFIILKRR